MIVRLQFDTAAKRWAQFALSALVLLPALMLLPATAAAQLDPDESVETGRDTLGGGLMDRHPWYDSSTDDLQLVPLTVPPPSTTSSNSNWNWDWPEWVWDFDLFGTAISLNLFTLLAWLLVLVAVFFLIRYLIRLYERRETEESEEEPDTETSAEDRVEALPETVKRSIHDLLGEARRLYQQGDYNQAIVYLYSHMLVQLDRRQFIRLAKGKTNRQYLREASREASLRPLLEQTMIVFEDAYFGKHTISQQQFEACLGSLPTFEALLGPQEVAA